MVRNKYSLWIRPKGTVGDALEDIITKLSEGYKGPLFLPHITLIGDIIVNANELQDVKLKIKKITQQTKKFHLQLENYKYKDESFRCLYLPLESSQLVAIYNSLASDFSQVHDEHFKTMPHLSVLYGNYSSSTKDEIIKNNPLQVTSFEVDSFELHLTNDPVSSWKLDEAFPLD